MHKPIQSFSTSNNVLCKNVDAYSYAWNSYKGPYCCSFGSDGRFRFGLNFPVASKVDSLPPTFSLYTQLLMSLGSKFHLLFIGLSLFEISCSSWSGNERRLTLKRAKNMEQILFTRLVVDLNEDTIKAEEEDTSF